MRWLASTCEKQSQQNGEKGNSAQWRAVAFIHFVEQSRVVGRCKSENQNRGDAFQVCLMPAEQTLPVASSLSSWTFPRQSILTLRILPLVGPKAKDSGPPGDSNLLLKRLQAVPFQPIITMKHGNGQNFPTDLSRIVA